MSVHDAVFWVGVTLLGAGLFVILENKIYGWILIAVGVVGIAYGFPSLSLSGSHLPVPLPALAPFVAVAVVLSVLVGIGHELRREQRFQRTLRTLSSDLLTFSLECGTLINSAMRTSTARLAEERFRQTEKLHSKFGPRIRAIENELLLMPETFMNPAFSLLGQNILNPDVSSIAQAASNYLTQTANRLPQPRQWIKRKAVRLVTVGCLMISIGTWIGLFLIDKWAR